MNERMAWRDPEIKGPPTHEMCQRCFLEAAEHHVWDYGQELLVPEPFQNDPDDVLDVIAWDLCGTCLAEMTNEARRTPEESDAYWETRLDRRFEEDDR